MRSIVPVLLIVAFYYPSHAQTSLQLLKEHVADDPSGIISVAVLPKETREMVMTACMYPEALIKMQSFQVTSSEGFKNLIKDLDQQR